MSGTIAGYWESNKHKSEDIERYLQGENALKQNGLEVLEQNLQEIPPSHHQEKANKKRMIATTKALLEGK